MGTTVTDIGIGFNMKISGIKYLESRIFQYK